MSVIATITVQREARGEGDQPLLIIAGSGKASSMEVESHNDVEAIEAAIAEALGVIRGGLAAKGGSPRG